MKKKAKYNVVVVGAGVVGVEMIRCLRDRKFPIDTLKVFARSNREMDVDGKKYQVEAISEDGFNGIDIALFAGTEGEKGAAITYAKAAVKRGVVVIDNGADFRMEKDVPLVVPEVNAKDINPVRNWFRSGAPDISNGVKKHKGIIANPNCSTVQMVVALWPIYKKYGIKQVIVTTLQASSGAGKQAVEQLSREISQIASANYKNVHVNVENKAMPQQLAYNVFPQIGGFTDWDFTSEEWKLVNETHKIMGDKKIKVSATTVRVPVRTGHSESVYVETKKPIDPKVIKNLLSKSAGIIVIDEPKDGLYPMPKDVEGKYEVFIGRIRRDPFNKNGLWLWVVADNLLKGAALNAVQIAEYLIAK